MRVGERDGLGVGNDINGANRIECCSHVGDGFGDILSFEAELAAEDGSELVQNLHADYAARQDHLSRYLALGAGALGICQDIDVKERGHRALASSRSNAYPWGMG